MKTVIRIIFYDLVHGRSASNFLPVLSVLIDCTINPGFHHSQCSLTAQIVYRAQHLR